MIGTKAVAETISAKNADGIEIFYNFINDGKELEVTRSTECYIGDIVIPATVNYSGSEFKVTAIGRYAFSECFALRSVTIPNGVKTIGEKAFIGCSGLTSVTISDGVDSIGYAAFACCSNLISVNISSNVKAIGDKAFNGCSSLTSINVENIHTIHQQTVCCSLTPVV